MNPLALLPLWIRLALIASVLAAIGGAFAMFIHHEREIGRDEVRAEWNADKAKRQAAFNKALSDETAKTQATEGKLKAAVAALESRDAENAKTITDLRADLRRNSRAAGGPGLRDPFAGTRLGGGGSASATASSAVSGAADEAAGARALSAAFENLLLDWAADADEINRAYIACRADALNVRALTVKP